MPDVVHHHPIGAESPAERADGLLHPPDPRARQTVLVVTHVTPTKVLVADAVDAPLSALYRMELSPATLTEVQWYAGGQASLRRFNDAAHLL